MNLQEQLWTIFQEEALEIAHAASKIKRFSAQAGNGDGKNNLKDLIIEMAQFEATKEALEATGVDFSVVSPLLYEFFKEKKKQAIMTTLQYARNRGTLMDHLPGWYEPQIACPADRVFVFGSNLAGRHGRGAAKDAVTHYGAIYGNGKGLQGMSYAIPTKDHNLTRLSLDEIEVHVREFVEFTKQYVQMYFYVTAVGCGLAGHEPKDIAPMFKGARGCMFPQSFQQYLE